MESKIWIKLEHLRVSQLFISELKLNTVQKRFPSDLFHIWSQSLPSLPVWSRNGEYFLTDGHTKAVWFYLMKIIQIPIYPDLDALDYDVYEKCIQWCEDSGVYRIPDLASRVIPHDEYQLKWIDRCEQINGE